MPYFHPPPELMIDHAIGDLDPWVSLLIDLHSRFCPMCRDALALSLAVGGVLFADLASMPVSDAEVAGMLARLDDRPNSARVGFAQAAAKAGLAAASAEQAIPSDQALATQSWAGILEELGLILDPGLWPWDDAGQESRLIIPPGAQPGEIVLVVLPPAAILPFSPQPTGSEMTLCLILDGVLLSNGNPYRQGDFWSSSQPAVRSGADRAAFAGADGCLCLVVPGVN